MLYNIRRVDKRLSSIDCALTKGDIDDLKEIIKEHKQSKSSYAVSHDGIDEGKVMEEYSGAMVAFKKRCLELPEFPCMSCNKLCFRRECIKLDRCLKPVTGENWQRLLDYIDSYPGFDDDLSDGYICNYCIGKFWEGVLPARCILNGHCFHPIPKEISDLNEYEKLLIQRAKAFQVVLRMNPVGGKKLPPSYLINKVHSSTFHLPLPLQETLKRLPTPTQPILDNGELFVLLRCIPNTKRVVWQNIVDITKVYGALKKLKDINPIYSEINLPALPSNLELGSKISEHVVESDPNEDKNTDSETADGDAMLRKVAKDEEAELYRNYTIQTLHAPRLNEKATDLYQLLKINENPLDARCKQLEEICFPAIFTHGVYGMQFSREVSPGPSEYIKALLQSRDSRFCLNQQFIFFHFHQATIRQLSSGIYHKLGPKIN